MPVSHFAGRASELAVLTSLLRDRTDTGDTVVISAIGGTAGVGKTALAVRWAHKVADRLDAGRVVWEDLVRLHRVVVT